MVRAGYGGRRWCAVAIVVALALLVLEVVPAGALGGARSPAGQQATTIVAIERPGRDLTVAGSVLIEGWAADPTLPDGTGVDAIELYLDGAPDVGGTLIGRPDYGVTRGDVAGRLNDGRFANSGFRFRWSLEGITPGPHAIYAFAHSTAGVWAFATVPITVSERSCLPQVNLDGLQPNVTVSGPLTITGYAADPGSSEGTGVAGLTLYVDAGPEEGGTPVATAAYGATRPEATTIFGEERFGRSGFTLVLDTSTLPEGPHTLYFVAEGTCGAATSPLPLVVQAPAAPPVDTPPPAAGSAPSADSGGCIVVNIDVPRPQNIVSPPFVVSGSAYDLASSAETGVSRIVVYNGPKGSGGTQLGPEARYGFARRTISETVGARFLNSGFSTTLNVQMANGTATLYVYASGGCGEGWRAIPVTVDNTRPPGAVDPNGAPATPATQPVNAAPGTAPSSPNAPQAPVNLQYSIAGSSVTLSWGASPGGNVRDYTIWQSTDGNSYSQIQTVASASTSQTLTSLNPATIYYYFVVARNQNGEASARSNLAGPVVLGGGEVVPPGNLQVTGTTPNSVTLNWSKSTTPGVTGYYVFLGQNQTTPVQYSQTSADQTTAQLQIFNPGATLTFYVTAVAGSQQSKPSNTVGPCNLQTGGCGAGTSSAPTTAPSLSYTSTGTAVVLTWTPSTGSGIVSGYSVYQSVNNGQFVLAQSNVPATTATITGLLPTQQYAFYVVPIVNGLAGPQSNTVGPFLPGTGSGGVSGGVAPAAPTGLLATANGPNQVLLQWSPPTTGTPASYQIFQSANGAPYSSAGAVPGTSTTSTVPVTPGSNYTFYVVAVNGAAQSPQSNVAGPVVAGQAGSTGVTPPASVSAQALGARRVRVSWTPVPGAAAYRVYRSSVLVTSVPGASATYDDTVPPGLATVQYTVSVVNSAGIEGTQSAPSPPVNVQ